MTQDAPQFRQVGQGTPAAGAIPTAAKQAAHPQAAGVASVPMSKTHSFFIQHTSPISGKYWEGQFTCKKMSVRDFGRINVRKIQLNGGFYFDVDNPGCGIDERTDTLHNMISHLEISLIQSPADFILEEEDDPTLLQAVYEKVIVFENSFLSRRDVSQSGGGVSSDSSGTGPQSGDSGHVEEVGGSEVQASLEA